MMIYNRKALFVLILGAVTAVSGCATAPREIDTSESAELSFDGLYPVTNTRRNTKIWVREDFDLSGYDKILLQGAAIEYRPVKRVSRTAMANSSVDSYPVSDKAKEQIRDTFTTAFKDELANTKGFEVVTEPGPDVLIVRGYLLDVISRVPPDTGGMRSEFFLASVGEGTLVIELVDANSGTTLVRAAQRRSAEAMSGMIWSSPVTNMSEVRRLANDWAKLVRTELEQQANTMGIGSDN